jgi:hypothetical protein
MNQTIIKVVMVVAALSLPFVTNAKGNSFGKAVLLKDANGVTIGRVIGMEAPSWPYVLTREGYRTYFKMGKGMVEVVATDGVFYDQIDCEDGGGNAYLWRKQFIGTVFSPLFNLDDGYEAGLLYSPINAERVPVNISSNLDPDGTCTNYGPVPENYFPAYPNNPDITGIANTQYPNRMLVE